MVTKKTFKPPKSLALCADMVGDVRAERLDAQKTVIAPLAEQESALREHLINTIPKSDATGIAGKRWQVKIVSHDGVEVTDKQKMIDHAFKNKAKGGLALLSISINEAAVKEIWEKGGKLPGVKPMKYPVLSVIKR